MQAILPPPNNFLPYTIQQKISFVKRKKYREEKNIGRRKDYKLEFIDLFAAAGAIASPWGEAGKNRLY